MSLSISTACIPEIPDLYLEVAVHTNPVELSGLLSRISNARCTAEEFMSVANYISADAARILLTATFHRSMAYASEVFMPLEAARALAAGIVRSAGDGAHFYSTCLVDDEVKGVRGWKMMVTPNTFESVLYCVGREESALFVAVAED